MIAEPTAFRRTPVTPKRGATFKADGLSHKQSVRRRTKLIERKQRRGWQAFACHDGCMAVPAVGAPDASIGELRLP
jgi:hypothetical protein